VAVILRSAATISGASMPETGFTQLWWSPGTAGGSTADATDILARFRAAWDTVKVNMDPGLTLTFDPVCIAIESTTGVLTGSYVGTTPGAVTGTATGDMLPHQTQGLVRFGTASIFNGRRLRGRLYLPGPNETVNSAAGAPVAGYLTTATTAFGGLLSGGGTSSAPVIWHRPVGGAGGGNALITSVTTAPSWSVLRSRRG